MHATIMPTATATTKPFAEKADVKNRFEAADAKKKLSASGSSVSWCLSAPVAGELW